MAAFGDEESLDDLPGHDHAWGWFADRGYPAREPAATAGGQRDQGRPGTEATAEVVGAPGHAGANRPPRGARSSGHGSCTATYRREPPSKSPTTRTAHFGAPCATGSKLTARARSGACTRQQTPSGPASHETSRTGHLQLVGCPVPGRQRARRAARHRVLGPSPRWTPGSGSTEPTTSSTTPSAPPTTSTLSVR